MEDYWAEYQTVRCGLRDLKFSHSEDEYRNQDDECEDVFLESILAERLREDREISETELTNSRLYYTLTERQKAQLIQRTRERNVTLRQKRMKVKSQKPDLWSIFSGTDNSSTGTRSRSATPDSLDSISPPLTPPDPSPKNWVDPSLSRSRASLDSGHHSLIMTSSSPLCATYANTISHHNGSHYENVSTQKKTSKGNDRFRNYRYSPPGNDEIEDQVDDDSRIYRPSSLDMLSPENLPRTNESSSSRTKNPVKLRRQRSCSKDLPDHRKSYNFKGNYDISPSSIYDYDISEDVRGICYKPIGSLHITKRQTKDIIPFHEDRSQNYHTTIRRTQSIKPHPRDPFGSSQEKENQRIFGSDSNLDQVNADRSIKNRGSTDLGFRVIQKDSSEKFPDVVVEVGRGGQTNSEWLHEEDLQRLMSLALLELDIVFSENNVHHNWRKRHKKLKNKENRGVFGKSLETLHQKDQKYFNDSIFMESKIPHILQKLISNLELRGLKDEGILRIPGNRAKADELRRCVDNHFYEFPQMVDEALRAASPHEIAALFKLFLREISQPLLTYSLAAAFYKTHKIKDLGERLLALNMLVILLPSLHRSVLKSILELCSKIIANEAYNKMGLYNVAMIVAPNIFLPSLQPRAKIQLKSEHKEEQLNSEMEYARVTTDLMQVFIKYQEVLWIVPSRLISQVRHQYDSSPKNGHQKPIHKLLGKKSKDLIQRPINNEVDYQNGIMRISAPQFAKFSHPIKLDWRMTARDIIARFIEEQSSRKETPRRVSGRRELKMSIKGHRPTALSTSIPEVTTCLLRGSLSHALEKHALHERGGNITERRIDHNACLIAVYQDNPNAEFYVKCHHPGGLT